jgi:hypothetical protein
VPENYSVESLDCVAAASNLTGKETYLAVVNSSGLADLATGATRPLCCIIQGAAQGRAVSLCHGPGIVRVIAGGNINPGDKVTANGSGQAVVATATGSHYFGWARNGASAGQVFDCRAQPAVL